MRDRSIPGRSQVTQRALADVIRAAVVSSYGVVGLSAPRLGGLIRWLGLGEPGIRISVRPAITVDLYLTVAHGLPIAEVARQVDSAVRYAMRQTIDRELAELTVHIGRLVYRPTAPPSSDSNGRAIERVAAAKGEPR